MADKQSYVGIMLAAIHGAAKDLPVERADDGLTRTLGMTVGGERLHTTLAPIYEREFAKTEQEEQALMRFFGYTNWRDMGKWLGDHIKTPESRAGIALKCWELGQALKTSRQVPGSPVQPG